jgi:hypothetical protein
MAPLGAVSVQVQINGDEKDCVTVLASVTAAGDKLPLAFLAAGKSSRVDKSQIGVVEGHWRDHSESSWQRSETFQTYLSNLRAVMGEGSIHLMLDSYSAHRTSAVKESADRLGITLRYIPPGLTDEFRSLDRVVFNVLKARAKRLFHERFRINTFGRRTKQEAVQDMVTARTLLGDAAIDAAWEISAE